LSDEPKFNNPDGTWVSCEECPIKDKCKNNYQKIFIGRADYNCKENWKDLI
jgi:hypothetical protein